MMTKIFKNKAVAMVLVAALILAVCATLFVACGDKSNGDDIAVTSIALSKSELSLEVGGEHTLTATVSPDNATDKTVTWTSSNAAIATVQNGKVTAVAEGSATITAKAGDKTAACAVTVTAASDGLAGKTFVLDKVEGTVDGKEMSEEEAEAYFNVNKGISFEFGTDGTFAEKVVSQMAGMHNMVVEGTYTLDGTTVTFVLTSGTRDGEPIDVSSMSSTTATFDGTYLVTISNNGQDTIAYLYYKASEE